MHPQAGTVPGHGKTAALLMNSIQHLYTINLVWKTQTEAEPQDACAVRIKPLGWEDGAHGQLVLSTWAGIVGSVCKNDHSMFAFSEDFLIFTCFPSAPFGNHVPR